MKRMAFIVALFAPNIVFAAQDVTRTTFYKNGTSYNLLSAIALNASAGTRTITLSTGNPATDGGTGYTKVRVSVFYTWAAATTVTATPTCAHDGTNYASYTTRSCSAGTCTDYLMVDSYTTGGASANFSLEYDVRGCNSFKVVFGGASAGASDLVNVQAVGIVGE